MKINTIAYAVWQQYGRALAYSAINWRDYALSGGPVLHIGRRG